MVNQIRALSDMTSPSLRFTHLLEYHIVRCQFKSPFAFKHRQERLLGDFDLADGC
jgi:hypothetical protein